MNTKFQLVDYTNSNNVTLDIYPLEKGKEPVSKYLFGEFSEHLGHNIYHGEWAQILDNPSFEPACFFGSDNTTLGERLSKNVKDNSSINLVEGFHDLDKEEIASIDLIGSLHDGVAYCWAKYGEGDASYSLVSDGIGSWTSQKIVVRSLETHSLGIQQPIFLPLHREDKYELSVWLKGDIRKVEFALGTIGSERKQIAQGIIEDVKLSKWKKHTKRFLVNREGIEKGEPLAFSIASTVSGTLLLDHCFLFPADNINRFDSDIIQLLKESNLSLLRYPGGNFVSQYHWKDGVGPIELRPIRFNRAWNTVEYNHVGTDEFMGFCHRVGCEPLICVNAGDGTPKEAADWVEYCNGGLDTGYGKLRARNGHPKPYRVRFWEIGNELYGSWQTGHAAAEEYAERYERFYKSMTKVDPTIRLIANGNDLDWNRAVAKRKRGIVRSFSIHPLIGDTIPKEVAADAVYHGIIGYTFWFADYLEKLESSMIETIKEPKIAITELMIIRGYPPNHVTLAEAIYYSGIVNDSIRKGDLVELITHSALVNHGGGLKKRREIVYADPVFYARKLYAIHAVGKFPLRVSIKTPMFNVQELYDLPKVQDVPYVDAVAFLSQDEKTLSLIVTNRISDKPVGAKICFKDFKTKELVKSQILTGPSYMSTNSWKEPDNVRILEVNYNHGTAEFVFPAHSITFMSFDPVIE